MHVILEGQMYIVLLENDITMSSTKIAPITKGLSYGTDCQWKLEEVYLHSISKNQ